MIFSISTKIQDGGQNSENSNFFQGYHIKIAKHPAGPEFAQNHSIRYGFEDFQCLRNFKMVAKIPTIENSSMDIT